MVEHRLPGAAIVILEGRKNIFKRGNGLANVEQCKAVDPDTTLLHIGSISKALALLDPQRSDGRWAPPIQEL